jgi:hypothetical protein
MGSGTRRRSSQLASHLASKRRRGFSYSDWLRACPRTTIAWVPLPFPVPPSVITEATWYRNINLLAIGYAFRPRLRSRLTLSRRTLLRKPWTIGGGESHPSFVTHAGILTSSRSTEAYASASRSWNALLPRAEPAGLHTHSFGG